MSLITTSLIAVLTATTPDGTRIDLHEEQAYCSGEARAATYTQGKERVPGCWVLRGTTVFVVWLDADTGVIPVQEFKKAETL